VKKRTAFPDISQDFGDISQRKVLPYMPCHMLCLFNQLYKYFITIFAMTAL